MSLTARRPKPELDVLTSHLPPVDNPNFEAFTNNAKATANVLAQYIESTASLATPPPRVMAREEYDALAIPGPHPAEIAVIDASSS